MPCRCAKRREKIIEIVNKTKLTMQELLQRRAQPVVAERPQPPQPVVKK